LKDEKGNIHTAKKEAQGLAKDIKKGKAQTATGQQLAGGFMFESRSDGMGEKCAAEAGLDELEDYTSALVDRALASQRAIRESELRLERVNSDMESAGSRLDNLNDRGRRYAGK